MQAGFRRQDWEFTVPFRIAYKTRTHAQTLVVELTDGNFTGRGEALGVSYHGETLDSIQDQLTAVVNDLANGIL